MWNYVVSLEKKRTFIWLDFTSNYDQNSELMTISFSSWNLDDNTKLEKGLERL